MTITSLKDALKTLAQSLQLSTIFPSTALVLLNVLVIFPKIWPDEDWSLTKELVTTLAVLAIVILSYILYAFNIPLIRLLEGYWKDDIPWVKSLKRDLRSRQLESYIEHRYSRSSDAAGRDKIQEFDTFFPSSSEDVLPTTLGNTIAAFEDYPYTRYGIDAVVLWPRLIPVLRENKYIEIVAQQKAVFDFMLNMLIIILLCGIELISATAYMGQLGAAFLWILLTYLLVRLLYLGTVNGAVQWGASVRVAFDLYRGDLAKLLHLKPASSYREEVTRWRKLSQFILSGNKRRDFVEFSYESQKLARETSKSALGKLIANFVSSWSRQ
jgi:hypothetical protein